MKITITRAYRSVGIYTGPDDNGITIVMWRNDECFDVTTLPVDSQGSLGENDTRACALEIINFLSLDKSAVRGICSSIRLVAQEV